MFLSPADRNMRTFLGVLMVLIVSGECETITGVLGGSVLLSCNCSEINLDKEFKWQMEKPNRMLVLTINNNTLDFIGTYNGRVKTFLNKTNNNCSILLTNITADDQGEYSCRFFYKQQYNRINVYLNVSASYNLCQQRANDGNISVKVFQCGVNGRYGDAEIQWNLDGQILTNSSTTSITNSNFMNVSTGLYEFHSNLTTKLNTTSEPTCHVKAKGISTNITQDCMAVMSLKGTESPPMENGKRNYKMRYLVIMLVVALCLVLWGRRKPSTSSQRVREAGADNSYC